MISTFFFKTNSLYMLRTREMAGAIAALLVHPAYLFYLLLHLRLSSLFTTTTLCDMTFFFSKQTLLLYNIFTANAARYFFFTSAHTLSTTASLFFSANWLEREAAEMAGIHFLHKADTRNLLLPFADFSTPGRKEFPSIGVREITYAAAADTLIWMPVSYQF